MIGGLDILIKGTTSKSDLDCILRTIRFYWRKAILESPGMLGPISIVDSKLYPIPMMEECFIYSNVSAYQSWEEFGRTDKNADHLIYIVVERNALCLTFDNARSATFRYVKEIISALEYNRNFVYLPVRNAA